MPRTGALCLALITAFSTFGTLTGPGVAQAGDFVSETDYDFDCDGVRDLVRQAESSFVGGVEGAGQVVVTYSRTGSQQTINQATPGVPGTPEQDDFFGGSHTAYDRDGNGCDELVIGTGYEDIGRLVNAGMVTIIPGSTNGLDTSRAEAYTQDSAGFPGSSEDYDWFGGSVAAGETHDGTPYLLISSTGESRELPTSVFHHGAVYYWRSGTVTVIHQDSPGVAGVQEDGDYFGGGLAVSDRYFVVGNSEELIHGSRWTDPKAAGEGMVHVFSHTLTSSGMPKPVGSFHQNTPGISGEAEWGDYFGATTSVLPYRPAGAASVGALVAVGTWETVGSARQAGMAHLVYMSPDGSVRELAAITQNTPGVTGVPESGDYLGYNVVLANLNPNSTIAEPGTTAWAVAVGFEETAHGNHGAAHIFGPGWQSGSTDIWLEEGLYGIPDKSLFSISVMRASATHLHLKGHGPCVAVPWQNMFDTVSAPVILRQDDCA